MGVRIGYMIRTCDICGQESEDYRNHPEVLRGWVMVSELGIEPSRDNQRRVSPDVCPGCAEEYGLDNVFQNRRDS